MMTLRPMAAVSTHSRRRVRRKLTLGSKGYADSVSEDIDTLQNARAAVIGELNLLVCTTSERRLGLCSSAAEGARRGVLDGVHGRVYYSTRRGKTIEQTKLGQQARDTANDEQGEGREPTDVPANSTRI